MMDLSAGPSPRVRGNLEGATEEGLSQGSIPACAGKPPDRLPRRPAGRVHPRVCGETVTGGIRAVDGIGPSPRVRGNPNPPEWGPVQPGSIPACAGKPLVALRQRGVYRVHPRVCGETIAIREGNALIRGPSPRVRGNPARQSLAGCGTGSIPACAGKPTGRRSPPRRCRVHPRVCGETAPMSTCIQRVTGPSPRVRGNHFERARRHVPAGSIPACAGKPRCRFPRPPPRRVHPRVCGETPSNAAASVLPTGPSPRVRGNHDLGFP